MTALDRLGQQIHLGDYVSFQLAHSPPITLRVVQIDHSAAGNHSTLHLGNGLTIDSLSVQKTDAQPTDKQQERSPTKPNHEQFRELLPGPTTTNPVIPHGAITIPVATPDPWDTPTDNPLERGPEPDVHSARRGRDHPAPIAPKSKRAPARSHKTPVKKAPAPKKGTHNP